MNLLLSILIMFLALIISITISTLIIDRITYFLEKHNLLKTRLK